MHGCQIINPRVSSTITWASIKHFSAGESSVHIGDLSREWRVHLWGARRQDRGWVTITRGDVPRPRPADNDTDQQRAEEPGRPTTRTIMCFHWTWHCQIFTPNANYFHQAFCTYFQLHHIICIRSVRTPVYVSYSNKLARIVDRYKSFR